MVESDGDERHADRVADEADGLAHMRRWPLSNWCMAQVCRISLFDRDKAHNSVVARVDYCVGAVWTCGGKGARYEQIAYKTTSQVSQESQELSRQGPLIVIDTTVR